MLIQIIEKSMHRNVYSVMYISAATSVAAYCSTMSQYLMEFLTSHSGGQSLNA